MSFMKNVYHLVGESSSRVRIHYGPWHTYCDSMYAMQGFGVRTVCEPEELPEVAWIVSSDEVDDWTEETSFTGLVTPAGYLRRTATFNAFTDSTTAHSDAIALQVVSRIMAAASNGAYHDYYLAFKARQTKLDLSFMSANGVFVHETKAHTYVHGKRLRDPCLLCASFLVCNDTRNVSNGFPTVAEAGGKLCSDTKRFYSMIVQPTNTKGEKVKISNVYTEEPIFNDEAS